MIDNFKYYKFLLLQETTLKVITGKVRGTENGFADLTKGIWYTQQGCFFGKY